MFVKADDANQARPHRPIPLDVGPWAFVPDNLVRAIGLIRAHLYVRIWRYCQMEDGVCTASMGRIAEDIGMKRKSIIPHLNALVAGGYIIDKTPGLKGRPHIYADGKKVPMSMKLTYGDAVTSLDMDSCAEVVHDMDTPTGEPVHNMDNRCPRYGHQDVHDMDIKKTSLRRQEKNTLKKAAVPAAAASIRVESEEWGDYYDHPAHQVFRAVMGNSIPKTKLWQRQEVCEYIGTDEARLFAYRDGLKAASRKTKNPFCFDLQKTMFDEILVKRTLDDESREREKARVGDMDIHQVYRDLARLIDLPRDRAERFANLGAQANGVDPKEIKFTREWIEGGRAYADMLIQPILDLMKTHEGAPKDWRSRRKAVLNALCDKWESDQESTFEVAATELLSEKEADYGKHPETAGWPVEVLAGSEGQGADDDEDDPIAALFSPGGGAATGEDGVSGGEQSESPADAIALGEPVPAGDHHPGPQPGNGSV